MMNTHHTPHTHTAVRETCDKPRARNGASAHARNQHQRARLRAPLSAAPHIPHSLSCARSNNANLTHACIFLNEQRLRFIKKTNKQKTPEKPREEKTAVARF